MARTTPTNGAALRALRERSGLTVRDVIRSLREDHDIRTHEGHIRNIEIGAKNAGPRLVNGLAAVLRVPVVAILNESPVTRAKVDA